MPTLMVQGGRDPIIPPATAEATAASFPAGVARLVMLDDASHDLIAERWPDACLHIRDFVVGLK